MFEILGTVIAGAVPLIGGIVWLVRLEGRINTEQELRKALADRLGSFEVRIYAALERIENKLDDKVDRQ